MHIAHVYDSTVMHRALLEAVLVGALCGAIGAHVLLRKLPFFTITVAHGTFPGVVLAVILGASVLGGALVSATIIVLAVWVTRFDGRLGTSTIVGVALAGSFGAGALLESTQPGFSRDLTAILVGQILAVQRSDIVVTAVVAALVLIPLLVMHKELVLAAFDPIEAAAQGRSRFTDLVALAIVAAAVVTTVPAVGTILSVALLTIPAMTARLLTRRVESAMAAGALIGAGAAFIGLSISAEWRVAAGASITLCAAAIFLLVLGARSLADRASRWRGAADSSDQQVIVLTDMRGPADLAR